LKSFIYIQKSQGKAKKKGLGKLGLKNLQNSYLHEGIHEGWRVG